MKKNIYVVPSIMVVEINQSAALMLGSDVSNNPASSSNSVLSRGAGFSGYDDEE